MSFYCLSVILFISPSVLAGWRRSNTFPVPFNGVGTLSDAAVEVLIHTLYSPTLASSALLAVASPPRVLLPLVLSCVSCIFIFSPPCCITSPFFLPHDTHTHVARNDSDNHVRYKICRIYLSFTVTRYLINHPLHNISIYIMTESVHNVYIFFTLFLTYVIIK